MTVFIPRELWSALHADNQYAVAICHGRRWGGMLRRGLALVRCFSLLFLFRIPLFNRILPFFAIRMMYCNPFYAFRPTVLLLLPLYCFFYYIALLCRVKGSG